MPRPGDVLLGQVEIEGEDQHRALLRAQPAERAAQLVPQHDAVLVAGDGPRGLVVARPPQAPPRRAAAGPALVGDDREEPRAHPAAAVPIPAEAAPGVERRLLDGVLRLGAVAQHRVGQPERRFEQRPEPALEGGVFAGGRGGLSRRRHESL